MDANAFLNDRLPLLRSFRDDAETSQADQHKHAGDNKHNFQRLHFGSPLDRSSGTVPACPAPGLLASIRIGL